jgi:hypothetical protein
MSLPIENPSTNAPIIEVTGLSKSFRTLKKKPGFGGAIRKAVDNVSFKGCLGR